MMFLAAGGASFGALGGVAIARQDSSALPSPSAVVKPQAFVSAEPVTRGKEFQAAIVVEIAKGFHMNSHKPTDAYLIATTLTPQLPAGFQLLDTIYPAGQLEKFTFSPNKPLDVYTGKVTLRLRIAAAGDAPLGATTIPVTLRYQACNDTTCLQPVKIPLELKFSVAAAGAKSRAVHPEIFSANAGK
ncbi:MAG: protein-disulfide reductase DsbD domain-containing protein [Candidatus Acidiferrales bacterium]